MKITFEKRKVLAFAIAIGIMVLYFIGNHYTGGHFLKYLWIFDGILFLFLLVGIMAFAGFFILDALFFVAAELSLLIFLAQAYCGIPGRTIQAEQALKNLVIIGLIYIGGKFIYEFKNKTKEKLKSLQEEKWSREKIFFVVCFIIFTVSFIWQICLVMFPIISNLCVFK